ncbi:MAG: hypothetical protein GXP28_00125 [Planctomycetes bacterium]|nr:hypothetical protein [Planctomycetota bacterium]
MAKKLKSGKAFTLLEVILAISLTAVVLVLLMTALELLITRVESSRSQVESSQVARGVLNQIAGDLRAARYYAQNPSVSEGETEDAAALVLGIYGTAKQLRIDRSAIWRWERITRDDEETSNETASQEMPQTIRYFLSEGDTVLAETFAAEGIQKESAQLKYTGLTREQMSTVAWILQLETTSIKESEPATENPQLLAPEVLDIEFAYYDGKELLDQWDSAKHEKLPQAVQITLMLANEPLADNNKRPPADPEDLQPKLADATEYRLFVRLPKIEPQAKAPGPRRIEQNQEPN